MAQRQPQQPSLPQSIGASPSGASLYARFALAGALGCSITHGALTPMDVVKTRVQLDPAKYSKGMLSSARMIVSEEGAAALLTGIGPTFAGYFVQGAFKFAGYEFWKKTIVDFVGTETAIANRTSIYLTASALCEFFADVALCPLEATRIRLVSQPGFANGLVGGFTRLLREEGVIRGFYSGFGPLLLKQIPYTQAKFVGYERLSEAIYHALPTPKDQMTPGAITAVNLASGLGAGLAAAFISQPADTLLSKVNKEKGATGQSITSRLVRISMDLGPRGLFLGLGPRLVFVGTLTAFQFAIYGGLKPLLGATNGVEIAKPKKAIAPTEKTTKATH